MKVHDLIAGLAKLDPTIDVYVEGWDSINAAEDITVDDDGLGVVIGFNANR